MKNSSLLLRMAVCLLPVLYLTCGSLNEVPLAGGSGAGNPGGTVSVALTIITDTVLPKAAITTGIAASNTNSTRPPVIVKDSAGLPITITGVQLNSSGLRLVLDEEEWSHCPLDSLKERPSYLSTDSQSLIINKQFSFDAYHGSPDSTVPSVIMPVARYTGVRLNFDQGQPAPTDTGWKSKILITGSFVYNGQTQNFRVEIDRTFSPYYKFVGGSFDLTPDDTTHLELRFNASRWFSRVNFKQQLDQGGLIFNPKSAIIISSYSYSEAISEIEFHIKTDFINSGRLAVY